MAEDIFKLVLIKEHKIIETPGDEITVKELKDHQGKLNLFLKAQ